ncbi:unnamed protein product [Dracunculus medinensis]|uniref:ACB domain-containing protein n=1 Tax=Dracunculus medinensis TaxID=318479 RepID=A0A0N4UFX0_DRAME|nr:unnamed protein product [Dracunculus medinensis]
MFFNFRNFSSQTGFEEAQKKLKTLSEDPGADIKLKIYALFKQATLGDVSGQRPGALDFVSRAKFDAWKKLEGTSQESAQQCYIDLVDSLIGSQEPLNTTVAGLKPVSGLNISIEGKIFKIRLNRPSKFNAITLEMYNGITEALNYSSTDKTTSVTVLTGTGNYFCSGNDLSNFLEVKRVEDIPIMAAEAARVLDAYTTAYILHKKPLIGLINGPAIGISVTLLPLFNLVLASDKATFHTPFTALGQSPEGCSSYTYPFIMGMLKASEVLLFGRKLTAIEAMERNLINEVIPDRTFFDESQKRVEIYSKLPPESLRMNKQLLCDAHSEALMECKAREIKLLEQRWQSEECIAALKQFINRKK